MIKTRCFGRNGPALSEIGFGAWAIGGGWGPQQDADSLAALHRALDLGVSFIDTAAGYGNGRSERLIGQALRERQSVGKVFVATKTPPIGAGGWPPSPYCRAEDRYPEAYLKANLEDRLTQLGSERIDLLQLHTWTRAWNRRPVPFEVLRKLQASGRIGRIGVSTPEHDQNSVIDLIRGGWVDAVQVIYNIFEQEPAAELLDVAGEYGCAVIVRVPYDEGALTGKLREDTVFAEGDFRRWYFAGDRLARAAGRAQEVAKDIESLGLTLAQVALKFCLSHPAVSTVIPGSRNAAQAESNCGVSALPDLPPALLERLRRHNWRRAFWYGGK